ncbi:helix-turn-helix domain-containing protein [Curvivirga aplysinae]|uniref:helix-turn-helix domain-containing protein n=1 Tax=Curvivirga aplysinae TaxID=2529852 RepID=UPI001C3F7073|nr:response regulator transcription factor [Curvivirga aplysinae]
MTEPMFHFKSISEFADFIGHERPEHPFFGVCHVDQFGGEDQNVAACATSGISYTSDFYTIAIKRVISGEIYYGRTKYDFDNGSMMFTAPRQVMQANNVVVSRDAIIIAIHEDFFKGHPIRDSIKKYGFFSYTVNEALHLSPKEEKMMRGLMQNIHDEYKGNPDEFSKELILSQLDTLLKYSNRYYKRQFLNRAELSNEISERFQTAIQSYFDDGRFTASGMPKIEDIAAEMNVSPRYLSDTLKAETGKAAQEHIHLYLLDEAKDLLLANNTTVSEVAYKLGFEYPQYFSRLFKKKIGVSPKEFRNQNSIH